MFTHIEFISSSLSISFTMFAILSCGASSTPAAIIACLFPLAPACASPLSAPNTTMLSSAITSAPEFTSPSIIVSFMSFIGVHLLVVYKNVLFRNRNFLQEVYYLL